LSLASFNYRFGSLSARLKETSQWTYRHFATDGTSTDTAIDVVAHDRIEGDDVVFTVQYADADVATTRREGDHFIDPDSNVFVIQDTEFGRMGINLATVRAARIRG